MIVSSTAFNQSKSSRGSCTSVRTGGLGTPGGRGRGDLLVVQLVLLQVVQLGVGQVGCAQPCQPCCLGRVHELGDELVVVCAVVGPATGAPAAQSGWVRPPAGRWVSSEAEEETTVPGSSGSQPGCSRERAVIVSSTAVRQSKSSRRSCTSVRTDGLGTPGGRGRGGPLVFLLVFSGVMFRFVRLLSRWSCRAVLVGQVGRGW